jgi:hypothetical protein
VRFLAKWDSSILAYDRRDRILPPEYKTTVIKKNGDVIQTFLVDGRIAGSWDVDVKKTTRELVLTPFQRIPRETKRELEEEGERLVRWYDAEAPSYAVRWTS